MALRVAVVGSGSLGIYYGTRLALSGLDVSFLMRHDYLAVKQSNKLVLHQEAHIDYLTPVHVFDSTKNIGPVDLVLIAIKTTANHALRDLISPLIKESTILLTVQNGLGSDTLLSEIFGSDRIVGGLAFIATNRIAPGEVKCFHPGSLTIGDYNHSLRVRTNEIAELFQKAGVKTRTVENLDSARWHKLVWNIPFNGLTIAHGGITTDKVCADPLLKEEVKALMREVQLAASYFGHTISDDFLHQQFDVTPPMGAYKPSSLVDYLSGKEIEIESIWGEPLRRAAKAGAQLPRLENLYKSLKVISSGKSK